VHGSPCYRLTGSFPVLPGCSVVRRATKVTVRGRGYPFSPGHYVTSITYREGLMALPGQGQLMNLR